VWLLDGDRDLVRRVERRMDAVTDLEAEGRSFFAAPWRTATQGGYLRKRPRPKYPSSASTMSTITMIHIRSGIDHSFHDRYARGVDPHAYAEDSTRRIDALTTTMPPDG
jgi:hypothetical protein